MGQADIGSGSPFRKLYAESTRTNKGHRGTAAQHSVSDFDLKFGDFGHFDNYTRKDDVLPTISIDDGTSNVADVSRVKNEEGIKSDVNQIWQPSVYDLEIALFFKSDTVLTELEKRG
ncbi:hypothetical protein J1N35_000942 [Gossypium stocksii]|uniref:Uncharacterized protein n=1 Tax=Gossypium stocksii TaxID=47602 RepID=A0A9D3WHV8_9ROSI|nr:hypothetical protein J1N35_000942 [Gossypium stocksii]